MSVGYEKNNRMGGPVKRFYDFGAFRIDANKRLLLKDGETVPLASKAFDTLLVLVENRGELVTKDELMSRLWPDTVVEEGSLTRNIYLLRKALGEARGQNLYIVTIPGQGYRFVADVCEISEEGIDLRVTERTRTTIVVSEEESEDRDEQLLELPLGASTARAELPAPATAVRALAVSQTGGPSIARIVRHKPVIVIWALVICALVVL
ncbi:MAG TPA: transcriptional regulator, partial [Blastocatellia bacterium]|nr:transcriptional regulator [Blastocatellia bacterium]